MTKRLISKYVFLIITFVCSLGVYGQQADVFYTSADKEAFDRYVEYITPFQNQPIGDVIIESGKFFLGLPYVAHTLEKEPEQLVVNMQELDCTTFVETVLALSETVKGNNTPSFAAFLSNLQQIRYREGTIVDYTSRLHYMTEWIMDNEKAGIVKDVTCQIGGVPLKTNLSFMSGHPDSYKQLADPVLVGKMRDIEKRLNEQANACYIPKQDVVNHLDQLQNGDIVLFTTSIGGLDVTHAGFIYHEGNKTTFIHASTGAKKVVINDIPLVDYMARIKSNTGMIILRPQEIK